MFEMFSAPAENRRLIRDAIPEWVIVVAFWQSAAFFRVRLRISGRCNSDSRVHIVVKRFSVQMDNSDRENAYEYVEEMESENSKRHC